MTLTRERIEGLAPDQASLSAALKLAKPASWPVLAIGADAGVLWGECQGSGSQPYRVVVSPEDAGYKCTCPSRKFPCKHVLAVLWMRVETPARFTPGDTPQWVQDWMGRRRTGARPAGEPEGGPPKPKPSLAAALDTEPDVEKAVDPKAAARAQAQRQRLKADREGEVLAGLDDLDRWTLDQLSQGLAGFAARAEGAIHTLSARLVDAKAGGLAVRLDRIATDLFRVEESRRADFALERLAVVTLIASAYRTQHHLPSALREDVRRAIGWSQRREELLADANAPRVMTTWLVAANRSEVQPDRLRRLETWLLNTAVEEGAPQVAVLMDFVPVAGGAYGFPFEPGDSIDGEVVFYPSAAPLRGLLASRKAASKPAEWPRSSPGVGAMLAAYHQRLSALPWLDAWPLLLSNVELRTAGRGRMCVTDGSSCMLPVARTQTDALTPLLGVAHLSLLAQWDGYTAHILAADTPIGRWHEA